MISTRFTAGAWLWVVVAAVLICAAGEDRGPRDVTFLVLTDLHYGSTQWDDNDAPVKKIIDRINNLPGTPGPKRPEENLSPFPGSDHPGGSDDGEPTVTGPNRSLAGGPR